MAWSKQILGIDHDKLGHTQKNKRNGSQGRVKSLSVIGGWNQFLRGEFSLWRRDGRVKAIIWESWYGI